MCPSGFSGCLNYVVDDFSLATGRLNLSGSDLYGVRCEIRARDPIAFILLSLAFYVSFFKAMCENRTV